MKKEAVHQYLPEQSKKELEGRRCAKSTMKLALRNQKLFIRWIEEIRESDIRKLTKKDIHAYGEYVRTTKSLSDGGPLASKTIHMRVYQ